MNTKNWIICTAIVCMGSLGQLSEAQQFMGPGRGGPGGPGWGRGPGGGNGPGHGPGHGGGGGGRDHRDDNFDRREPDMFGAFVVGQTIISGRQLEVINTNAVVSQIKLCARYDDLIVQQLEVVLGNGQRVPIHTRDHIARGSCTVWKDLPGNERRVVQILIAGVSDHDLQNTQVLIYGRQVDVPRPPRRVWQGLNNTSCGDGSGPFMKDRFNNRVPVMPCPDQKPNGGPIGQPCDHLAPGTQCYGWSYQTQPGFFCAAPNGMTPPFIATIYSMYQCQ